jgi:hypothetical protein
LAAKPAAPAKPATKAIAKAKPKATAAAKPAVAKTKPVASKAPKAKKPKLVRDSFTFPESEYQLIATLKQRALNAGREIKKSEVLRAGLAALVDMAESGLLKALDAVERIKTGRPSK